MRSGEGSETTLKELAGATGGLFRMEEGAVQVVLFDTVSQKIGARVIPFDEIG